MFNRMFGIRAAVIASVLSLCAVTITACGSGDVTVKPTRQGTISLDAVEVGMPESTFKDAILTFVPDPKGSVGGKTQYLSRGYNSDGAQIIAQCKDGTCFMLQALFNQTPVTKEVGMKNLKNMIPDTAPAQSKVDDNLKTTKQEVIYFGDNYKGEVNYFDTNGTQVGMVNVYAEPAASATAQTPDSVTSTADKPAAGTQ